MNEETKKELTIEELEEQYKKTEEQYKVLGNQLKQKKKEEEDRKQKQLSLEKETRYKEIEEVSEHLNQLIKNYTKDYGSFSFKRSYSKDNADDLSSYLWRWFF